MGNAISTRNFDAVDDFGPFLCKSRQIWYGDPFFYPPESQVVGAAGIEPATRRVQIFRSTY